MCVCVCELFFYIPMNVVKLFRLKFSKHTFHTFFFHLLIWIEMYNCVYEGMYVCMCVCKACWPCADESRSVCLWISVLKNLWPAVEPELHRPHVLQPSQWSKDDLPAAYIDRDCLSRLDTVLWNIYIHIYIYIHTCVCVCVWEGAPEMIKNSV